MSVSDPLLRELKGTGTILIYALAHCCIALYCNARFLRKKSYLEIVIQLGKFNAKHLTRIH